MTPSKFADQTMNTRRDAGAARFALPALGALAGAGAAWLALMSPAFLPSLARFTCRVTNHVGGVTVTAPSAELARERAQALAGGGDVSVEAARARLRDRTAELRRAPEGPLAALTPAAECAALLRARAELSHALAGTLTPSVSADAPEGAPLSNEMVDADARLERAVEAADPSALRAALLVSEAAEDRWLAEIQPEPRRRFSIWLARELDRADQFRLAAEDLEALQTPDQRERIRQWLPQLMLELEGGALGTLASMPAPGAVSAVRPRLGVWALGWLAGLLAGALLAVLARAALTRAVRGLRRATPRKAGAAPMPSASAAAVARAPAAVPRAEPVATAAPIPAAAPIAVRSSANGPRATRSGGGAPAAATGPLLAPPVGDAWLHLVGAEDARRVARAVGEVAVPLIARGTRVLVVEAGQRLRLHEFFGCAPRWGVGECLSGELPLLGTVQRAGVRDLYLLAAGSYPGRGSCEAVGRLLDEARRHFSAVVVALDGRVPAEFRALASGRAAEAWWPQRSGQLPRGGRAFGERLGIPVTSIGLPPRAEHWLEALERRVEAVRKVLVPVRPEPFEQSIATTGSAGAAGAVRPGARPGLKPTAGRSGAARPAAADPASAASEGAATSDDPTVYRPAGEDERNRERLRFLKWMRQVRAERSRRPVAPVS